MNIEDIALKIRQEIFKTSVNAHTGHIAPVLSMAEIMAVIYFDNVLKYNPQNPHWEERDFFILSKGHACLALYSTLALAGYFSVETLKTFAQKDSILGGHPNMNVIPGVEASTGSLGHGLSFAVGVAIAHKLDKVNNQIYVVMGDGECEEGSVWEGFMSAVHNKLDNLVVVIDHNKFQAMDTLESILSLRDFASKLKAFGFSVSDINGHDCTEIRQALLKREKGKPRVVIANTIKGKGISFMENKPLWHMRQPNNEEMKIALNDLFLKESEVDFV